MLQAPSGASPVLTAFAISGSFAKGASEASAGAAATWYPSFGSFIVNYNVAIGKGVRNLRISLSNSCSLRRSNLKRALIPYGGNRINDQSIHFW